jgi:hypothetical protein
MTYTPARRHGTLPEKKAFEEAIKVETEASALPARAPLYGTPCMSPVLPRIHRRPQAAVHDEDGVEVG